MGSKDNGSPETGRVRFNFVPTWDGALAGWAVNFAVAMEWRVQPEMDRDDLLQEFWMKFNHLVDVYPEVNNPRHFMALFKRACFNFVVNKAKRRTRRRQLAAGTSGGTEESDYVESLPDPKDWISEVEQQILEEEAPKAVREILIAFKGPGRVPPRFLRSKGQRETTNEFLCRVAGRNPRDINLARLCRSWASGDAVCTA